MRFFFTITTRILQSVMFLRKKGLFYNLLLACVVSFLYSPLLISGYTALLNRVCNKELPPYKNK